MESRAARFEWYCHRSSSSARRGTVARFPSTNIASSGEGSGLFRATRSYTTFEKTKLSTMNRCPRSWNVGGGRVKPSTYVGLLDRKSTRLNSSHLVISYAVFCLKKKKKKDNYCSLTNRHRKR